MRRSENNERYIYLTPAQVNDILDKANDYGDIYAVVKITIFTGLRRNEIHNLKWSEIDFNNQRVNLRASTTKIKRYRSIPIPDDLTDFLNTLPREGEYVITIKSDAIGYRFAKLREKFSFSNSLQVDSFQFKDLRHVYAQALRVSGVSLDDIQSFLGHSSPVITHRRYAQSGGFDGVTKVNRLSEFLNIESL
jgi:integrase